MIERGPPHGVEANSPEAFGVSRAGNRFSMFRRAADLGSHVDVGKRQVLPDRAPRRLCQGQGLRHSRGVREGVLQATQRSEV